MSTEDARHSSKHFIGIIAFNPHRYCYDVGLTLPFTEDQSEAQKG